MTNKGPLACTGRASHLLGKGTLFFLTSHKEICQQVDPEIINGTSALSKAILLGWPQCGFTHWPALLLLVFSRLSWNCGYNLLSLLSTWAVMYISLLTLFAIYSICMQIVHCMLFHTIWLRASDQLSLINIFPPDIPLNPARRGPAIQ